MSNEPKQIFSKKDDISVEHKIRRLPVVQVPSLIMQFFIHFDSFHSRRKSIILLMPHCSSRFLLWTLVINSDITTLSSISGIGLICLNRSSKLIPNASTIPSRLSIVGLFSPCSSCPIYTLWRLARLANSSWLCPRYFLKLPIFSPNIIFNSLIVAH